MLKALPPRWHQLTNPRAWCRQTATNAYYKLVSRRSREYLSDDMTRLGVLLFNPLDSSRETEEADAVRRLLGALPERRRQVLAWHVAGATYAEIASRFEITESTVRTHISLGVADLEKILLKAREERA